VSDGCHGCLVSPIHMSVDGDDEGTKLLIELILKFFHEFEKIFFRDEWVGIGDIAHGLNLVYECFMLGCMCKDHHHLVGVCAINASTMHDEVHSMPVDVSQFLKPLCIHCGIETLYMAPSCLLIGWWWWCESHSNYIVHAKKLFDGSISRDNRLFHTCFYDVVEKCGKLCVGVSFI
jgi:hypothetical protein